jgi:hypothetical protein
MREGLRALRNAGLTRSRFSAKFGGRDGRGFIILNDVLGPIGFAEHHIWIRPGNWHGTIPQPGRQVEFVASIEQYWKGAGEEDYGLRRVEVLR